MSLISFKRAICTRDLEVIAREYRAHRDTVGMSESQIYRLALSAEPTLDRGEWDDLVTLALEKHPADAALWLSMGGLEPDTLERILVSVSFSPGELTRLRRLRVGEKFSMETLETPSLEFVRVDPNRRPLKSTLGKGVS